MAVILSGMNRTRFDAHYREHYPRVLGTCRRMLGSTFDAQDAAQEVFMRGYRAFDRYRQDEPFGPWIGRITANYCIDLLRRRQRLGTLFSDDPDALDDVAESAADGTLLLAAEHDAQRVSEAVDALPEKYRVPIVMAYYSDASYDDIAAALDISRNHVGVLLLRAKQHLRRALADLDRNFEGDA
jgi:RNA polymerase sigma-70 factor (ECF subfamily)